MKRHPDIKVAKPTKKDLARTNIEPETIEKYFDELAIDMDEAGVKNKPIHIWNLDETGISRDHNPPKVIQHRKDKCVMLTTEKSPTTTLIGAASALGETIPPFFVHKGVKVTSGMKEGILEGTAFLGSETDWSNSIIFRNFMKNHFTKHVTERPVCLVI